MMSFEDRAIFNSVPLDKTLNFISRNIDENQIVVPIPKEVFFDLLRRCVENRVIQCAKVVAIVKSLQCV